MRLQGGCDGCLLSLQVFLVRKSKSFLRVKGLDVNSSGGGWEDAVWSQSNFILASRSDRCVSLSRAFKPPLFTANFCLRIPFQPFTAQPDLLRLVGLKAVRGMKIWNRNRKHPPVCWAGGCWRSNRVWVMDTPPSPPGNLTAVDIWKSALSLPPPPPHLPHALPLPPPRSQCSGVCKPGSISEQTQSSLRL